MEDRFSAEGNGVLREGPRLKYAFIRDHRTEFSVRAMCRVLGVHFSGFYAWLKAGLKPQAKRRRHVIGLIKQSWLESGCVYGYRKVHHDLLSLGERYAENTVARLMQTEGLRAQIGYKRRPGKHGIEPSVVAANQLDQDFDVAKPDQIWVTDITYIRTHEGWLYLAVVIDLYARKVVGWLMHSRMHTSLVLNALLMALWRRKPKGKVVIHSDQDRSLPARNGMKLYRSLEDLQTDLDEWMAKYNERRPHSGRYCYGKTPMQTFSETIHIAVEKRSNQIYKTDLLKKKLADKSEPSDQVASFTLRLLVFSP